MKRTRVRRGWVIAAVVLICAGAVATGLVGALPRWLIPRGFSAAAPAGLVTREGTQLVRNGQPFTFSGINIYNANSVDNCGPTLGQGAALADSLEIIGTATAGRAKVIRAWFFQPMATIGGVRNWDAFDHTLAAAKSAGFLVIPTLGNQGNECEASDLDKTESWYRQGYREVPPQELASYRSWVAEVVSRYRDDPTIAFWQLMDEAETSAAGICTPTAAQTLRSFADDLGSLIKSIDRYHLVSLGTIGTGQCGAVGEQYERLHESPNIDLCEYHDYHDDNSAMPGDQ